MLADKILAILILLFLFLLFLTGCTWMLEKPYTSQYIDVSHVAKCHIKLISASSTPRWQFWNTQNQAWVTNTNDSCKLIPLSGSNWLDAATGPVGSAIIEHSSINLP